MKLFIVLSAILAISLAREIGHKEELNDLDAEESVNIELLRTEREDKDLLDTAAATYGAAAVTYNNNYIPPSQRPPRPLTQPLLGQNIQNPSAQYTWPQNNYNPTPVVPPQNQYIPSNTAQGDYQQNVPTVPTPAPAPVSYPQNNYVPSPPQNNYPQNDYPQQSPQAPQQNYWAPYVIKNEQNFGENGAYNYEYQISDGTHVGEQGWLTNPNTDNESVVKKGWYSFPGADGRIYTVTWWADDSGYHAFGDHLPTPPPVPPAIQAALDQAEKDEAQKNKPVYNPTTQAPTYYPAVTQQPTYYPQQTYPQQQYPQLTQPQQQYPPQTLPQQPYPQQQYPQQPQTYPQQPSYGK